MSLAQKKNRARVLGAVLACALAAGLFLLLYFCDNKYTAPGPKGDSGVLILREQDLAETPVVHLVHGWEYYGGLLLTPGDFQGGQPRLSRYTTIGEYGGFEADGPEASPHGSASYRLTIALPPGQRSYTLELPEVFSACRVYVNGRLLAAMGEVDPAAYRPQTGNRALAFEVDGKVEILVAVTDYSHLYSGMVYPPAFGYSESVGRLLSARLAFRVALCMAALVVGALSLLVGTISRRYAAAALYGLLCLCFLGYAGYPVWKTFFSGYSLSYAIENLSFCAMLLLVMLLQRRAADLPMWRGRGKWAVCLGGGMCLFSLVTHLLLPRGSLALMTLYSGAVTLYEWLAAVYITALAARALLAGGGQPVLLAGCLVFDCALVADRLLPLYEPMVTGWFIELASFALLLFIGASIGLEVARQYRERAVLTDRARRMEQMLAMQNTYQREIERRAEEARVARHDLRHHFRAISGFLDGQEYGALEAYMAQYGATLPQEAGPGLTAQPAINVLAQYYTYLARQNDIPMELRIEVADGTGLADVDLVTLLSNLLENAVEACLRVSPESRRISLAIARRGGTLSIYMENSADRVDMRGAVFMSTKKPGRSGYGLASVRDVAARYGGEATFRFDADKKLFTSGVVLRVE
ncbi:GHKL domain-containing protein [Ruminococcaceae bacterium OttesenSCG-928-D13]|nr:GHKL domain-containing protein [Ruminococcaceae bacterium OttesenSCG-928-D13]